MTAEELKAATPATLALCRAVLETVREAGPQGAPEGPMYAAFQSFGIGILTWEHLIDKLLCTQLIKKSGHVLYWTGPEITKP